MLLKFFDFMQPYRPRSLWALVCSVQSSSLAALDSCRSSRIVSGIELSGF